MKCIYEETADMMMNTITGKFIGKTREEFVALFKERFPDPEKLKSFIDAARRQYDFQVAEIQRNIKLGE